MTGPTSGAHDPRILNHPEYARSYRHYLESGAPPDDAARLAYEWTRARIATAPRRGGNMNPVLIGILVAVVAVCGLGGTGLALSGNQSADKPSPKTPGTAVQASSSSPEPESNPTTGPPSPTGSPTAVATTVAPVPTTAAPAPVPPVNRPRPVASRPRPRPTHAAPAPACDPAYPSVCLRDGIGDYDCAGGTGNGPNYIAGPIRVLPPDPFGLDRDGDGIGCES